ncbi:beta-ketoacyl-ACP synthase [Kushneria phosphatilytica]|uniref:Beta-ketoacyl-ACP synthase n=1 Tax=Kushneria phosphatilytica TaxID=657387 RepID=A0A1S1NVD8_9GAMM|nr:beta-ketoacyl-ACP synthase [Kushneria phosphatilytica]OHV10547.1 beta-ketoacyl-[acyl-carrier-protein] synthase II [Kushneria phosphatilytica]QEL11882.1 beta-ketoacyl-ACP synthase [Kushneria phosphatilytica]
MSQHFPCRLSAPGLICSIGSDHPGVLDALGRGQRGLQSSDRYTPGRRVPIGAIDASLPDTSTWPADHISRNNQLITHALEQLGTTLQETLRQVAPERIGVIMGTSTSGVLETERAIARTGPGEPFDDDYRYARQEIGAPARFIAEYLGIKGPAWTLSTACSSGARALGAARRMLRTGRVDAVIAGGADTLCGLTVNGFDSLGAISDAPCQPFSANRRGINIGEAAALFIVTAAPGGIQLAGVGESSDAHHISAPEPTGNGAFAAMEQALTMAELPPGSVDYLNLHGTATEQNDAMEARAIARLFGTHRPPSSSTKALTGHTLGAAGALEAAFCWLALTHQHLPLHAYDGVPDPTLPALPLIESAHPKRPIRHALSNAFAFGGNNVALLLEAS